MDIGFYLMITRLLMFECWLIINAAADVKDVQLLKAKAYFSGSITNYSRTTYYK